MVVRAFAAAMLIVAGIFVGSAQTVSACHESTDLCLPCPESTSDCGETDVKDSVVMIVRFVTSALPTKSYGEAMLGATFGSSGQPYVVVSFEWDTPNHTAPAGHADVPFHIELTSDDAELDPDTMDIVFSANATTRENYFFEAEPEHATGDVSVDFSITPNPGQPGSRAFKGTVTLEGRDDPNGLGPFDEVFRDHWGWLLVLLLVGVAIGMAIRQWLMRSQAPAPRPLAL